MIARQSDDQGDFVQENDRRGLLFGGHELLRISVRFAPILVTSRDPALLPAQKGLGRRVRIVPVVKNKVAGR